MDERQKQIEEIYEAVLDYKFNAVGEKFLYDGMCEAIYNAGYRNCKDKVVLTKDEYNKLMYRIKKLEDELKVSDFWKRYYKQWGRNRG